MGVEAHQRSKHTKYQIKVRKQARKGHSALTKEKEQP